MSESKGPDIAENHSELMKMMDKLHASDDSKKEKEPKKEENKK